MEKIIVEYWYLFVLLAAFSHSIWNILHIIYALLLTKSYETNDFSVAYPISRGTGPLMN